MKIISIKEMSFIHLLVAGVKKQRGEDNNSDQSDSDHLSTKPQVYHKHSSDSSDSDLKISSGRGKEPASRRPYRKKGILAKSSTSLPKSRQEKHKGKFNTVQKTLDLY